jgi:hypothetical protein
MIEQTKTLEDGGTWSIFKFIIYLTYQQPHNFPPAGSLSSRKSNREKAIALLITRFNPFSCAKSQFGMTSHGGNNVMLHTYRHLDGDVDGCSWRAGAGTCALFVRDPEMGISRPKVHITI